MKAPTIRLMFVLFLPFFFSNCDKENIEANENPYVNTTEDFETYIMDEIDDQHIPAMSVLIFEEDNILYENYFGQSNIEQNIPLEDDHLFLLASVSKVVTATALLQLYDDGHFELKDNINDYLSFEVNVPGYSTDITFQMLLTHTSAIADADVLDGQYFYGEDSPIALSHFIENYLSPNGEFYDAYENFYDFEPGTEHEYSNVGNALIGVLVEEISGTEFNEYCKHNIFAPLEMNHTFWRLDEITQTIVQPYDFVKGENKSVGHYAFTDYPNGGLRSTGKDMFKLLSAFVQSGVSNNFQLLNPETIDAMTTLQIPAIDDEMGLHLFEMNSEYNLWGHDGGEQGVATIVAFNPTTHIGAIIFTNQGEAELDDILEEVYLYGLEL